MCMMDKLNPLKKNPKKMSVADLKIAEGKVMKTIEDAKAALRKLEQQLKEIRDLIDEKQ